MGGGPFMAGYYRHRRIDGGGDMTYNESDNDIPTAAMFYLLRADAEAAAGYIKIPASSYYEAAREFKPGDAIMCNCEPWE